MSANASVYATGLDSPRGLEFGPDGALYVAEAGQGGTTSTDGQCDQVVPPVGPYTSGSTARISMIDASGTRSSVVEGLPSAASSPEAGGDIVGTSDVVFVDGTLYYTLAGAGCSHGVADVPNGVYRVEADGTTSLVADTSAFVQANPAAKVNPGDFEPDGEPYSVIELGGALYLVEPNHGAIDKVDLASGAISRVVDVSASEGHVVPTAIAVGPDGVFHVGNLSTFPVVAGASNIYAITTDGQISTETTGVTSVLGVAYDDQGSLYVLETSGPPPADSQFPVAPFSGRVVRVTDDGLETVATGLMFPTGMTMGPDGNLYVSNFGFANPPGAGQIVKIDLSMPTPTDAS
jgi:glucose/arabinose dehydrogenase